MKVKCPTCGKKSNLPDGEAGLLALCSACGASYRVSEPAPPPLPITAAQIQAEMAAPRRNAGWVVLWSGAGVAALVAIAAISWSLHNWSANVKSQKLAQATELKRQAEMLIAVGRFDQAQTAVADLDAFAARSPWPEMRKLADQTHQELSVRQLQQMQATARPAPAIAAAPPPSANRPAQKQTRLSDEPLERLTIAPRARIDASLSGNRGSSGVDSSKPAAPTDSHHAAPPRPPVRPLTEARGLTDEMIGAAITKGIDHLLERFDQRTYMLPGAEDRNSIAIGQDILCVYALMQCQQATNDPRLNPHEPTMRGLIEAMKSFDLNKYSYETYSRGLRATALALYNRPEDRGILNADATVLVRGSNNGGYSYQIHRGIAPRFQSSFEDQNWDNSNSQYGLLGVWAAAELGFEVPDAYWNIVKNHWTRCQTADGTWGYQKGMLREGTYSMTCAGLASMFVTHDYLDAPQFGVVVGRDPFTPPLERGLRWLETGDNSVNAIGAYEGYSLYGLERVGLASGFKFFGNHEWYRELATRVIREQQPGGGWANNIEDAYHLLFLSRGRHPILMNKVRFDGYWANRPRDAANLARFVGYQLERPLNWQVVPISRDWTDWMDSPILYLSSHKPVSLSEAAYDRIRSFVNNGGLLYMQADGGSPVFSRFAHEAAHKLFPAYEMTLLPENSPLCSTVFKIKPDGNLWAVSNGSRILVLFANEDLSKSWQLRDNKNKPYPFELGTNLFIYAAGKRDLRNHLSSSYIPPVQSGPSATYRLARLSYAGNWDPEPAAWQRFGRWFQLQTSYDLEVVNTPIKELTIGTAPIAQLTGTASYELSPQESNALKKYVESGGVLLIDLCGGTGPFDKGIQSSLLLKSFAANASHVLSPNHPMLSAGADGMTDLSRPALRPYAIEVLGRANGLGLPEEIAAGKGHVIFTSLDITSGLLGTSTWGILGYDPNYAQSLVKNVILWTLDGQRQEGPAPAP